MPEFHRRRSAFALVMATLLALVIGQPAVLAQLGTPTPASDTGAAARAFDIYPTDSGSGTVVTLTVEPGSTAQIPIVVGNTGSVAQDLRTYRAAAFTAEGGGLAIAERDDDPDDVTQWLDYPDQVLSLEPGSGVELVAALTIPDTAEPGEYVTALVGEHAEALPVEGTTALTQVIRRVIPIYITIPGAIAPALEISDVALTVDTDQGTTLRLVVTNTGNAHLRPEGEIALTDESGDRLVTIPVSMGLLLAGDETTLTFDVPAAPTSGGLTASVQLSDSERGAEAMAEITDLVAQAAATPVVSEIQIVSASLSPGPSADNVQFVTVQAVVSNTSEATDAQLSLIASRDGEEVERFPVSQSLALPPGDTTIESRYLPAEGWSTGMWTFELLLERVDPSGAAVVIASQPLEGSIAIP